MRLIDADVPVKEIRHLKERASTFGHPDYRLGYISALSCVEGMIASATTIDAEPVRHAAWQYEISFEDESKRDDFDVTCTGCGALFRAETRDDAEIVIMGRWDYCPFCGAKMDLEVAHEL